MAVSGATDLPVLLFAWGNPSRGDDALGPLLLDRLEAKRDSGWPEIHGHSDFQLQIEHALDLPGHSLLLFVDAALDVESLAFSPIQAHRDASYTSHALSPQALLWVCAEISSQPPPPAWLLRIGGREFGLGQPLSEMARRNLESALDFTIQLLRQPVASFWNRQT